MRFKILSAICFSLDHSRILSSGNGLNLTKRQNLRLVQIKTNCRRKVAGDLSDEFVLDRNEDSVVKGEIRKTPLKTLLLIGQFQRNFIEIFACEDTCEHNLAPIECISSKLKSK